MIWRGTHLRPLSQGPGQAESATGGTSNSAGPAALLKAQRRRELRATRTAIPPASARQCAIRAARNLLKLPALRRGRHVAVYFATGSELDSDALITLLHRADKRVLVPAIAPGTIATMRMIPLDRHAPLRRRLHGIREPVRRRYTARSRIDVVVLPLLGFDVSGTRLGSGAGYYDRWLARQRPRPFCVGYAYSAQETAQLPREPWDQPLDAVCTERRLRHFSRR